MSAIFLHGGGDHADTRAATFGRFANAVQPSTTHPLLLVVAEAQADQREASFEAYRQIFQALGVADTALRPLYVTPDHMLTAETLQQFQPGGVFVCGGMTPFYHQSLCLDPRWVAYLRERQLPYGGTSAGAAIAARSAILGGWQAERAGRKRAILFSGASEGLDDLTICPGLALVPFAVDVHASQWGTLQRLIHAVELGFVDHGWAIDEDTMLQVDDDRITLYGRGQAYEVRRMPSAGVAVTIHAA